VLSSNNAFRYLSDLPGSRPQQAYQSKGTPQQEVQRFNNQVLGGLLSNTAAGVGQQGTRIPEQEPTGIKDVKAVVRGTTSAVRNSSAQQLQNAQIQRANKVKRAKEEAERQRQAQNSMQRVGGRIVPTANGQYAAYATPRVQGGTMANRIQSMIGRFPGLHITETLGNRAYDVAHGVARVPTSYHYDAANPAVDIAGPQSSLWALYYELKRQGGYRQILWQVAGHYDHLHVA
jgi:hypothetical protein